MKRKGTSSFDGGLSPRTEANVSVRTNGRVNGERNHVLLTAAALGALTGLRSMAAPALLSHEFADSRIVRGAGAMERFLSSPATSKLLALFAGGEMIADKTSGVPDRTSAGPLIGRAVLGSLTGAAYALHRGRGVLAPATVAGVAAIGSTFAAFHLRHLASEKLRVSDKLLGVIEDAIVVAAGKGIAEAMQERL
jgi:uncharacterized membrane protein